MAKQKNKTRNSWFIKVRGSYLPANVYGWLTYIPFVAYLVLAAVVGIEKTNSTVLAVLFIAPNWVAATVIMTFIAARKSRQR